MLACRRCFRAKEDHPIDINDGEDFRLYCDDYTPI